MKNTTPFLFLLAALAIAPVARGGGIPAMEVTVMNSANKEVYKGTTDGSGNFSTADLPAGNYVVQVYSKSAVKGSNYGINVAAGKASASADSVAGEKIASNGVALKIAATGSGKITGSVGPAGTGAKKVASAPAAPGSSKQTGPTKMMNGKKYIWVRPSSSTLEGGHWVEEGSAEDPAVAGAGTKTRPGTPPRPAGGTRY